MYFASLQWDRRSTVITVICCYVLKFCLSSHNLSNLFFSPASRPSTGHLIKSLSLHPHMNLCCSQLKLNSFPKCPAIAHDTLTLQTHIYLPLRWLDHEIFNHYPEIPSRVHCTCHMLNKPLLNEGISE